MGGYILPTHSLIPHFAQPIYTAGLPADLAAGFFAAAFPICGGGAPSTAAVYGKNFPIWIFHGAKDPTVDVGDSRKMVDALKAAGAKLRYTEYPEVKHDSWTNAFAEAELLPWLFSQQKQ